MKISILIPCYNEELTIGECVKSCLAQTRRADQIIVVNDGSTDRSPNILSSFDHHVTVIDTPSNTGNKSRAQEYGVTRITGDIMVMTDADTILASDFLERIERHFKNPHIHAVAGYIKGLKHNWLTACRELDYIIGQDVHKRAQAHLNSIIVIPGCGGAFRMSTFRKYITFEHDTVTEDLDFTYKLHAKNFKVVFDTKAFVYTQDPSTIRAYIHQTRRWIGGGWQNLMKHWRLVFRRHGHALEISLIYIEGMVFGMLFFILPIINIFYFAYFVVGYLITAALIGIYGALRRKRYDLLLYAPLFPLVLILNSLIFFEQFVREVIFRRKTMFWFKPERRSLTQS